MFSERSSSDHYCCSRRDLRHPKYSKVALLFTVITVVRTTRSTRTTLMHCMQKQQIKAAIRFINSTSRQNT
ncbi:hypothetical protein OK016_09935 [Vibrio chagasii]|nr:hypothetical protein [Vibrio chagasii]